MKELPSDPVRNEVCVKINLLNSEIQVKFEVSHFALPMRDPAGIDAVIAPWV
jgi:hypothetical protein